MRSCSSACASSASGSPRASSPAARALGARARADARLRARRARARGRAPRAARAAAGRQRDRARRTVRLLPPLTIVRGEAIRRSRAWGGAGGFERRDATRTRRRASSWTTTPERIDVDAVHDYIAGESYWGRGGSHGRRPPAGRSSARAACLGSTAVARAGRIRARGLRRGDGGVPRRRVRGAAVPGSRLGPELVREMVDAPRVSTSAGRCAGC